MRIGVLALQGAFREHVDVLRRLGVEAKEVRLPEELRAEAERLAARQDEVLARNLANVDAYFHKLCPEEGEDSYWQRSVKSIDELDLVDLDEEASEEMTGVRFEP